MYKFSDLVRVYVDEGKTERIKTKGEESGRSFKRPVIAVEPVSTKAAGGQRSARSKGDIHELTGFQVLLLIRILRDYLVLLLLLL